MKLINITLTTTPTEPNNYNYTVKIQGNTGTWNTIHNGHFFVMAGQNTVTLDLDDLLYNFKYTGKQSIQPVMNVTNNAYEMPVSAAGNLTDYYYNAVEISGTGLTTTTKSFWFLPTQVFGYDFSMASGLNTPATQTLIPHIPNNPPTGFNFSTLLYNNSNSSVNVTYKRDSTTVGTFTVAAYKPWYRPLSGATEVYYINDNAVAKVDQCNKPYYLLWLGNNGGLQCQGFLKSSEFSVGYTNKTRIDVHNTEWGVSKTAQGSWKLKSQNLDEDEYTCYGEMFNSPYLVLLDMENSRLHYVNVKTTDYKEKKKTRTDKKPVYFEVEVESAEHLRV